MPKFPGLVGGSNTPLSYRADREQSVNLYVEKIEGQGTDGAQAWLRRRPGLLNFAGLVTEGGITSSVQYLLAGAGGGSGTSWVGVDNGTPGGGGAGAVLEGAVNLTVAAYPVVIGAFGVPGAAGTSSTWNGLTATGGGKGGNDTNVAGSNAGGNGASGGGAATSYFDGSTWEPFAGGTGSQGFDGGNSAINAGAGGGGAGGAGQSATQNNGGAGGAGVLSSISGASVLYASGGAGVGLTTRGTVPAGSYGSGGSTSPFGGPPAPVAAKSGVAYFRYLTGTYTATGGTITTSGAYTIHRFTASGTFTVTLVVPTVSVTAGGGGIHYCPAQNRCFVISTGGTLYEIFTDGSLTNYGTVVVGAYRPRMTDNGTFNQLLIVSGFKLYVFNMATNTLTAVASSQITDPVVCDFSDSYFLILGATGTFQWSALGDGTTWDALDIAKNSATADPWTSMLVLHREVWLFGIQSGQIWVDTGNNLQPFELAPGSVMHQGAIAPFTLQRCNNTAFWVGQNDQGRCVVNYADGYKPTRVSTHAVELAIGRSAKLQDAIACTFQAQGHTFYQLYVPDIQTCWVYDVSTGLWCEWADTVNDTVDPWVWTPWPVQMATFAFNKNLVVGPATALVCSLAWDEEDVAACADHLITWTASGGLLGTPSQAIDTSALNVSIIIISVPHGGTLTSDTAGNAYTLLSQTMNVGAFGLTRVYVCVAPILSATCRWTIAGMTADGCDFQMYTSTDVNRLQGWTIKGASAVSSGSAVTVTTNTTTATMDHEFFVTISESANLVDQTFPTSASVVESGQWTDTNVVVGRFSNVSVSWFQQGGHGSANAVWPYDGSGGAGAIAAVIFRIGPPEDTIRWLRRSPHMVNELKRVFYSRLDLLMDTGVGVCADPAIYMRYSNDGTQTWSTAQVARYGQKGVTITRVYWTRLGSGRDRVFEIYGDALQPLRIVDAYLEFSAGAS